MLRYKKATVTYSKEFLECSARELHRQYIFQYVMMICRDLTDTRVASHVSRNKDINRVLEFGTKEGLK